MKKIICALMSMIMLMSVVPGYVAFADEQPITIDGITVDLPSGTAKVDGSVAEGSGERTVTLRVLEQGTSLSQIAKENIQNIAQIATDRNGKYSYLFEINFNDIQDIAKSFDVYATNAITGKTCAESFTAINYDQLFENSIVMYENNKNAICYGERTVLESAPYIRDGKAYINSSFVNEKFGTSLSGDVDLSAIADNHVNINDGVITLSKKKIAANVGSLYKDFGIYVSANDGDDSNSGRFESPVKTLDKALGLAENFAGYDGTHIYIKSGSYTEGRTIEIKNKKNVTIESYAGENVSFNGKIKLPQEGFVKADNADILSRVGENAKNKIYCFNLSKYLSGDLLSAKNSPDSYYRLYANGSRQTLARYPDAEYAIARGVENTDMCTFPENERISAWDTSDAYAVLFNDTYTVYKRKITRFDNGGFTIEQWSPKNKLAAAVNILEELTVPGEWYIDRNTKMLYYYPERGLSNIELSVENYNVFSIANSENVTIKNITVEMTNKSGVVITDSNGAVIDNVKLNALGNLGVYIARSKNCVVKNCEISDINNGGVDMSGGDIPSLTPGNNIVENCHIYDYSKEATNSAGVTLSGMGNIVRNNVIHDSTSQGVLFRHESNGMLVENNEIYNVVRGLFDAGAVYGINLLENTGITIKNNYIHDLTKSYMNWGGIYAIYEDNGSSGITVDGNIVSDSLSAGLVGGGRDNTWNNNLFIDCNVGTYDTRMQLGGWIRGNENLKLSVINKPGYDEEKWKSTYSFWDGLLKDIAKEKEYLDTKHTDENGNEVYDETKHFDAGLPWNVTITNNLTIADKKSFYMNPIGLWWNPKTTDYNLTYENNLSVMGKTFQQQTLSTGKAHKGNNSMKYEITQATNTAIKKEFGSNAKPGEIYKVSAWIYAEKVNDAAKVKISTDKNPRSQSYYADFPYNIEGNGEVSIPEGEWIQVYCYWVSNDNGNSAVISFPKCSVGDVFYIDDIEVEKVMYSDMMLPSPNLNDIYTDTEYKCEPKALDLSETKTVLRVGEETPVKASNITAVTTDEDGNGKISGNELKLSAVSANVASVTSDNETVAKIEDGKIKALSGGIAKITVTDDNGKTASASVVVSENGGSVYNFAQGTGLVKDSDPVYGGETMRGYSINQNDSGITVRDGVRTGFKIYDSGLQKNDNNGYLRFGFKFGSELRDYNVQDKWFGGMFQINGNHRTTRTAGWHQFTADFSENADGKIVMTWYYDGKEFFKETDTVKTGDKIYITSGGNSGSLPYYAKEVYVVTPESGKDNPTQIAESYVLDNFEDGTLSWTTDQIDKLDQIFEGNTGSATDEFTTWFKNLDERDLTQTDSLFKAMPQFKPIEFAKIGNTALSVELDAPVERLARVNTSDKTVELIWNNVSGASAYYLEISRNPEMTDIVYKNRLDTNTDTAWIPESGTYYYRITAMYLSKNCKDRAVSDTYSFTVSDGISLDSCSATEADGRMTVSFVYNSGKNALEGKAILAEKDKMGKLIGTTLSDIPSADDGKITISGECTSGNVLECYLWNSIESMVPYCAKAIYDK